MIQWQDTFFGRMPDGAVRILQLKSAGFPRVEREYADATLDLRIDSDSWNAIVSSINADKRIAIEPEDSYRPENEWAMR